MNKFDLVRGSNTSSHNPTNSHNPYSVAPKEDYEIKPKLFYSLSNNKAFATTSGIPNRIQSAKVKRLSVDNNGRG
mgnify:CR=1 FL=1